MAKLNEIYNRLVVTHGADAGADRDFYFVDQTGNNSSLHVGLSPERSPSILVKGQVGDSHVKPPKQLTGIKVEFGKECLVCDNSDAINNGVFNIISCVEDDLILTNFFFEFFERYFLTAENIGAQSLKVEIDNLSKLFSYRKKKAVKTMMGLWSELYIISVAKQADICTQKWHEQVRSTFDFAFSKIGIDVKSYGGTSRTHFFKLEQLNNQTVEQTLVLSMCLHEDEDGPNVFDLLSEIRQRLNSNELASKLEQQVFELAGKDITDARRFNENVARESLLILQGSEIPCLDPSNTPLGVSEIKFRSDCSGISGLSFNEENQKIITDNSIIPLI